MKRKKHTKKTKAQIYKRKIMIIHMWSKSSTFAHQETLIIGKNKNKTKNKVQTQKISVIHIVSKRHIWNIKLSKQETKSTLNLGQKFLTDAAQNMDG